MDRVLHHFARLRCSPSRAFEMFTVNEHLQAWLTNLADVEPVTGGRFELFWDPGKREENSTLGCRVTALEADEFIAFEWKGPVQFGALMNDVDPLTHVVVLFVPAIISGGTWTDVHLIHTGWRGGAQWQEAADYFDGAWSHALANLERLVNGS
jgi:uncharacterized protein YndB with AHSA1/START domain